MYIPLYGQNSTASIENYDIDGEIREIRKKSAYFFGWALITINS